jgi:sulfur carrier protein ThiS
MKKKMINKSYAMTIASILVKAGHTKAQSVVMANGKVMSFSEWTEIMLKRRDKDIKRRKK